MLVQREQDIFGYSYCKSLVCIPLFRRHTYCRIVFLHHDTETNKDKDERDGWDGWDGKTDGPFPLWSQHPPHVPSPFVLCPKEGENESKKEKKGEDGLCTPASPLFFFLRLIHLHEGEEEEVSRSAIHESMTKTGNTKRQEIKRINTSSRRCQALSLSLSLRPFVISQALLQLSTVST